MYITIIPLPVKNHLRLFTDKETKSLFKILHKKMKNPLGCTAWRTLRLAQTAKGSRSYPLPF